MKLLESGTGTIEVVAWGDGETLFVLLHASATGPRSLARLGDGLGRVDRSIVAPAFAGYGQTQVNDPEGRDRVTMNCAIAREVLHDRSWRRRVVFGHSMGGLIALLAALDEERLANPVDALILYEPILIDLLDLRQTAHAEAHAWDRAIVDRLGIHVGNGDPEAGVRQFIEAWNETDWDALPDTARGQLVANADNLVLETKAVSDRKIDQSLLNGFATPTLLMRGDRSPPLIRFTAESAARAIPGARLCVIPECGHMGPILNPGPIIACVERFLDSAAVQTPLQQSG